VDASGEAHKPSRVPSVSSEKPETILAEAADMCQSAPHSSSVGGRYTTVFLRQKPVFRRATRGEISHAWLSSGDGSGDRPAHRNIGWLDSLFAVSLLQKLGQNS
jgi:hypothetical protein